MKSLAITWRGLVAAGCVALPLAAVAKPPSEPLCRAKYDAIHTQLDAAKAQDQRQRARGLQKALDEVSSRCTDDKLKAEHAKRVQAQVKEVTQRERDLAKARSEGRADKVAQREAKLKEAQAELARLQAAGPG